ncbi:MAG: PHP domain-containing protein, partial [Muribaculaceae bacterium]|nr:PHP domain-containing protein [Muribaculaceae bacterium]
MQPFIHLHVHSQFSVLDGQASIPALVDKAIADGMKGLAITDHVNMFGIKEFFNYVKKKNGKINDALKANKKALETAKEKENAEEVECLLSENAELEKKLFKPIFG